MQVPRLMGAAALLFTVSASVSAASPGHAECERQLKRLSKGFVLSVPEVPDMGNKYEYYFAWNRGPNSQPIATKRGNSTGSCVIDVFTFEGSVTLDGKELGTFGPPRRK